MRSVSKIFTLLMVLFLLNSSCTDRDDLISPPSDFYYLGSLPIPFYTHDSSGLPNINWGGEQGIFNLNEAYTGVSVDKQTGILSWNENLPLGENAVFVTATNSAGSAIATVLLVHQFSGQFNGGYNVNPSSTIITDSNLTIAFNVNGTLSLTDSGTTATGTWSFESGKLIVLYSIAAVDYELNFDLTYSVTVRPILEGYKKIAGSSLNIGFAKLNYQ
jgi:hypothetical protein